MHWGTKLLAVLGLGLALFSFSSAKVLTCPSCVCECCSSFPTPTPTGLKEYCPSADDLTGDYGPNVELNYRGWTIRNGGGVASRASFNILGGSIEYTMDLSRVNNGVNTNVYSISPLISNDGFRKNESNYCDAQKSGDEWCVEIDWVESNGNCGGQATIHTIRGPGMGCTAWGCHTGWDYNNMDLSNIYMKLDFDLDGIMTTYVNGRRIGPETIKPAVLKSDWETLRDAYRDRGAVIYSSQWVGWVPRTDICGGNGQLSGSVYTVKDLKIVGTVVKGPEPSLC